MIIIMLVLILLLCLSGYIIYNLYNKVEYLTTYSLNIVESIEIMRNRVGEMNSHIRAIDKRGSFQSDDEVGFFFKDLQEIQTRLNILFSIINDKPIELEENFPDQANEGGAF